MLLSDNYCISPIMQRRPQLWPLPFHTAFSQGIMVCVVVWCICKLYIQTLVKMIPK